MAKGRTPQEQDHHDAKCEASQLSFLYRQLFVTPPKTLPSPATNLRNQTGLITGSNTGLGLAASHQLLTLGLTHLILAVRSPARGEAAAALLSSQFPAARIEVWPLDLGSYASVQAFARRAEAELRRLDFAVLNAGVFKVEATVNEGTGHDEGVQVNYLSTARVGVVLRPVLMKRDGGKGGPGKLVIVGSETAAWAKFEEGEKPEGILEAFDRGSRSGEGYDMAERYAASKLLGQLFVVELVKRVGADDVVVNIVNPGLCYGSDLHRDTANLPGKIFAGIKRVVGRSCEVGARTLVDAVVAKGPESHGRYLGDCVLKPMAPLIYTPKGEVISRKLWLEMEEELHFAGINGVFERISKGSS